MRLLFSFFIFIFLRHFFYFFSHLSLCICEVLAHFLNMSVEMFEYIFHMALNSVNFFKIINWHNWICWYLLIFWKNLFGFFANTICTLNYFANSIFTFSFRSFLALFFVKFTISINMRWKGTRCWWRKRFSIANAAHLFLDLIHIIGHRAKTSKTEVIIKWIKHWRNFWFLEIKEGWHWNH